MARHADVCRPPATEDPRAQPAVRRHRSVRRAAEILRLAGFRGRRARVRQARARSGGFPHRRAEAAVCVLRALRQLRLPRAGSAGAAGARARSAGAARRQARRHRYDCRRLRRRLFLRDHDAARRCDHDALLPGARRARTVLRRGDCRATAACSSSCARRIPKGRALQTARMANGETVAQSLCREITARNLRQRQEGLGPIGAVVGATCEDADETVAALPNSFVLAPGVGAQGATMRDVLARMPAGRGRVLPNVSRAILANGSRREDIRTTIASLQDQARERCSEGQDHRCRAGAGGRRTDRRAFEARRCRRLDQPVLALRDRARSVVRQDRLGRLGGRVRLRGCRLAGAGTHRTPFACRRSWPAARATKALTSHSSGSRSARPPRRAKRCSANSWPGSIGRRTRGSAGSATTRSARRRSRTPGREQWVTFLRERRLLHQLELAAGKGARCTHGGSRAHAVRTARCVLLELSPGALAPARGSVGLATGAPTRTACRSSSIRPCTTATAKRTSR